ncbi:protein of unknown function [Pseudarcicella hirudinis]|uniref:Uncharacterized protein n=1 Tax=Pseudarcicella hirudinis TaxID=1079859 RepID=A0A1I5YKV8_9BACT|nr:DUF4173 domain-containing protein [Pseudarcicella hirudinis]SFQ44810.1 protein of unknown function [Pseudarcicella hirudinis]
MSLKLIFLVLASAAYSYLFYHQTAGINFLIFVSIIIVFMVIAQPEYLKNKIWCGAAAGSILSGMAIVWQHSSLAVFANICSLILVMGIGYKFRTSVYMGLIKGGITCGFSFFLKIFDKLMNTEEGTKAANPANFSVTRMLAFYIIPLCVTVVFYMLYASANPVFEHFFHFPDIEISAEFVLFSLGGIILITGFFFPFEYLKLNEWDSQQPDTLLRIRQKVKRHFILVAIKIENKKGVILLSLLNILLLILNIVDGTFIFSGQELPKGVDYSQYVHQGVNTLIVSILLAISIILYFFRGNQNFYQRNQWLVRLTCLWILQNGFLLVSIIYKNQLYIHEFGLTYKRIGVYVYLLLTLIGLITTSLKVLQKKTNWYLLRKNTRAGYFILVLSSFVNWDAIIANYNIYYARKLDVTYLLSLSNNVLPELNTLLYDSKAKLNPFIIDNSNIKSSYTPPYISQREFIVKRIEQFRNDYEKKQWQSWNYAESEILKQLNAKKL